MAGEGSAKFIAGPAVPMETRLAKEEYHGRGATPEEALQDCIDKIKDVDRDAMFAKPQPMLPPSSVGRFWFSEIYFPSSSQSRLPCLSVIK